MFRSGPKREEYDCDGVSATVTFWYRSLSAMSDSLTAAGLRIVSISEPPVSPDTPPELLPQSEADPRRFIGFLFFTLEAVSQTSGGTAESTVGSSTAVMVIQLIGAGFPSSEECRVGKECVSK